MTIYDASIKWLDIKVSVFYQLISGLIVVTIPTSGALLVHIFLSCIRNPSSMKVQHCVPKLYDTRFNTRRAMYQMVVNIITISKNCKGHWDDKRWKWRCCFNGTSLLNCIFYKYVKCVTYAEFKYEVMEFRVE